MRSGWRLFGLLMMGICLASCSSDQWEDASHIREYWGEYIPNGIYILKTDVFVEYIEDIEGMSKRYFLAPEAQDERICCRAYNVPYSIDNYRSGDWQWWRDSKTYSYDTSVVGIVPRGTRIQINKIMNYIGWNLFFGSAFVIVPFGEILDGEHKGMQVDLEDVSDSVKGFDKEGYQNRTILYGPHRAVFSGPEQ